MQFEASKKTNKVSDDIISQIRDSILSGKLKPGDKLSCEKDLIEQFCVSKATMREALRVLEVMGFIEMRKGVGGGAFIAEVDLKTTINSIINFLHFKQICVKDMTMVRYLIEPTVAQIATQQITDKDIENIKEIIGKEGDYLNKSDELSKGLKFHLYIARMTGNPILTMIVRVICDLLHAIKAKIDLDINFYNDVRNTHKIILECMIQKDQIATTIAMRNDVLESGRYLSERLNREAYRPEMSYEANQLSMLGENSRIITEGDPAFEKTGAVFRRVGSSRLYLLFNGTKEKDTYINLPYTT